MMQPDLPVEPPARRAGGAPPAGRRARSRAAAQPLQRPIIAICNDLYAPALRPLRAVARVVQFRPPAVRAPRCPRAIHLLRAQTGMHAQVKEHLSQSLVTIWLVMCKQMREPCLYTLARRIPGIRQHASAGTPARTTGGRRRAPRPARAGKRHHRPPASGLRGGGAGRRPHGAPHDPAGHKPLRAIRLP